MRLNSADDLGLLPDSVSRFLPRVADCCIRLEGIPFRCQASLLLLDDAGIRVLNRERRGIDAPTDVLSFPSVSFRKGTAKDHLPRLRREMDPESGCVDIGDIAISVPRAREQAEDFGHSLLREVCFLLAHGMLHLCGYDHMRPEDRAAMRRMEEKIMEEAGILRELTEKELLLLDAAKEAMEKAYAPYSRYRVGACVRAKDGRLFPGVNVENASYGISLCAERNAIASAIARGACSFDAIAIYAEGALPMPCGACRQFMREFGGDWTVLVGNGREAERTTLEALLPGSFGPESLPKK